MEVKISSCLLLIQQCHAFLLLQPTLDRNKILAIYKVSILLCHTTL